MPNTEIDPNISVARPVTVDPSGTHARPDPPWQWRFQHAFGNVQTYMNHNDAVGITETERKSFLIDLRCGVE